MKRIAVIGTNQETECLRSQVNEQDFAWLWLLESEQAEAAGADLVIHFSPGKEWLLRNELPALLNMTAETFDALPPLAFAAARFCGWNTFPERATWELACNAAMNPDILQVFGVALQKKLVSVKDEPGLVAPRILAMIINEACYGLADGICTADDMNTAMNLGTNYPYGPLEWLVKIGKHPVAELLTALARKDARYAPHSTLLQS